MNVTSTTAVSCSVPKRFSFLKCDYGKVSVKRDLSWHSADVVFINLYWKDGYSEKTGAICKQKSSSLHNQVVEMIYSL